MRRPRAGCARCHDHKFDPVSQKDYYRFYAFFNNVDEYGEDGRVANASPIMPSFTARQQEQIAEKRKALRAAEKRSDEMIAAQDWTKVLFGETLLDSNTGPVGVETNLVLGASLALWNSGPLLLVNAKDGKAIQGNNFTLTNGPLGAPGIFLDGTGALKTDKLPSFDSGKGWAFSVWVKRAESKPATLFSTMNYSVPPSSASYGEGV